MTKNDKGATIFMQPFHNTSVYNEISECEGLGSGSSVNSQQTSEVMDH